MDTLRIGFAAIIVAVAVTAGQSQGDDVPTSQPTSQPAPQAAPSAAEAAKVRGLANRLSGKDEDRRVAARVAIEDLPLADLPLVEAAANRDDLPPTGAVEFGKLLPLLRQRAKQADRAAHLRATLLGFLRPRVLASYDVGGHTNPKWDAAAKAFIEAAMAPPAPTAAAQAAATADAGRQMQAVLATGCNDPAVLALAASVSAKQAAPPAAVLDLYARAERSATWGKTDPWIRVAIAGALLRPVEAMTGDAKRAAWKTAGVRLNRMDNGVTELLAEPGVPPEVVVFAGWDLFDRTCRLHVPLAAFIHVFVGPLERRFPNDANVLALKGRAYVDWAWEARGGGWANTVTPQGWKDFADRLDVAEAALTQAWQLDPDSAKAPTAMLSVELGQGKGRAVMETWYARAMAADPDATEAVTAKMLYLEPKWHGDADAMLAFGHECVAQGNWHSWVPTVLVDAHARLAKADGDPASEAAYWLRPGVFDDVRLVYDGYLKRYPNNMTIRSRYAGCAVKCHQWKVADDQFRVLGDAADKTMFGNGTAAAMDDARQTAARLADDPAAQGR